jgi:hypothetical protein
MKPNTPSDDKSFPQLEALIDTLTLITEQMRGRDAKFCVSTASARFLAGFVFCGMVSVLKYSPLSTAVPTAIGPLGQRETACHLYKAALRRLGSFEIQRINANSKYKTSI